MTIRNGTPSKYVYYGLYFGTFQVYRSEGHLKDWLVLLKETMFQYGIGFINIIQKRYYQKERGFQIIVDETVNKVGCEYIWLWVAIDPEDKEILALSISKERNMFVAEHFLSGIIQEYGRHPVSTDDDGGIWYLKLADS